MILNITPSTFVFLILAIMFVVLFIIKITTPKMKYSEDPNQTAGIAADTFLKDDGTDDITKTGSSNSILEERIVNFLLFNSKKLAITRFKDDFDGTFKTAEKEISIIIKKHNLKWTGLKDNRYKKA